MSNKQGMVTIQSTANCTDFELRGGAKYLNFGKITHT